VCGEVVIWRTPAAAPAADHPEAPRRAARRTLWTGRIALALPAGAFLLVTLAGWAAILSGLKGEGAASQLVGLPYERHFALLGAADGKTLISFGEGLVRQSGGPFFNLFFLGLSA